MANLIKLISGNWIYIGLALGIYSAGMASGLFIEDRLEAGKRAELQGAVISLQADMSAVRDQRDIALRDLRGAEIRLAESREDAMNTYATDNAEIDTLIASTIAEIEANSPSECRATADDVERMRDIIQSLASVRNN